MIRLIVPTMLLSACTLPDSNDPRNCAMRQPFYPDEDGDGFGEPSTVFVGCVAPPGWVTQLAPEDSGTLTGVTGTTGDTSPQRPTADTATGGSGTPTNITGDTGIGSDTGP